VNAISAQVVPSVVVVEPIYLPCLKHFISLKLVKYSKVSAAYPSNQCVERAKERKEQKTFSRHTSGSVDAKEWSQFCLIILVMLTVLNYALLFVLAT